MLTVILLAIIIASMLNTRVVFLVVGLLWRRSFAPKFLKATLNRRHDGCVIPSFVQMTGVALFCTTASAADEEEAAETQA